MNCITVMTNGREGVINCGDYGVIEFTHFSRSLDEITPKLFYNPDIVMLEALPDLALKDMILCRHSLDLVDMEEYNEWFVEYYESKS